MRIKTAGWDARYFQMTFQLIFLSYGFLWLHWNTELISGLIFITSGFVFQYIADVLFIKKNALAIRNKNNWQSVLVSCLSLCLLLKTNGWFICVLASAITIFSKYIFRIRGKHIFNPSALGIAATVYLTGNAWISPAQWGSSMVLLFAITCLGCIVVTKVQKLDVTLAFTGTYAALLFARQVLYQGWPLDFFMQSVTTGSLLLFSFFMISDPKTTPDHPAVRIIWAMAVALISFYLTAFKFVNGTPIWVLVCSQPLVPLLDLLFKAKRFEWKTPSVEKKFSIINSTTKPSNNYH